MTHTRNEGIVITGGTFTSSETAVGRNAQINHMSGTEASKDVQKQLDLLLAAIEKHRSQIPNHEEVSGATQNVKEELGKAKPSRLTVNALLGGIAASVKSVSGLALAVEGLKAAVAALF